MRLARPHPRRFWPMACLLGSLAALPWACLAQSSYVLTTLKSPNSRPVRPAVIDEQNRVVGTAEYYAGIGLSNTGLFGLGATYDAFSVRWPAGTTSSVSPVKLFGTQGGGVRAVSSNGSKVTLDIGAAWVKDVDSGATVTDLIPGAMRLSSDPARSVQPGSFGQVADNGSVLLNFTQSNPADDTPRAAFWTTNTDGRELPFSGYAGAQSLALRGNDIVGGLVIEPESAFERAALWRQGVLTVIDSVPGRASAAALVNASGQAVLRLQPRTGSQGGYWASYGAPTYVMHTHGSDTPIAALQPSDSIWPRALNNAGVVVGRMGPATPAGYPFYWGKPGLPVNNEGSTGRAFIWRQGVTTDLNTWVSARGVRLPSGSVLVDARSINDQGSIVAQMRSSTGTLSWVRLTAQP